MFITPPSRTAIPLHARGQQRSEGGLVQQRVAVGEQYDVHVGLAREAGEHRRLVHAGTDRPDDTFGTQSIKSRPRTLHGLLPVIVGVMDQRDVDAVDTDALEARFERADHAVRAVVEHDAQGFPRT